MKTFACLFLVLLSGCSLFQHPNTALVRGVEATTSPILEEYEKYVIQRQPLPAVRPDELGPRWVKPRQDSVDAFKKILKEAKD